MGQYGKYNCSMVPEDSTFAIRAIPHAHNRAMEIDLGPSHPGSAGMLTGTLSHHDGRITSIDPSPGALHRGAELIFPARDYRQALSLANRHDWQAPLFGEWAIARLVEDALGIEAPARAVAIRVALAEHARISSHLAYLSFLGFRWGRADLVTDGVRAALRARLAEWTGNRVHPMAVRLGGVASDIDPPTVEALLSTLREATALAARLRAELSASGLGRGVAVVTPAVVDAYGLAGPVARASGVPTDLRRADPGYADVRDALATDAGTHGDAWSRFDHLLAEIPGSALMIGRVLDGLPAGPLRAHLPKAIRLPEGDFVSAVEAPLGRAGVVVTSRGATTPWRLRLRTASAANVAAWPAVLTGATLEELPLALASLPWVAGDLDK